MMSIGTTEMINGANLVVTCGRCETNYISPVSELPARFRDVNADKWPKEEGIVPT